MSKCRHFNGIQHERCAAGVRYHDLAEGLGCALRYPCLPHPTADREKFPIVGCDKFSALTDEEIKAEHDELDLLTERFLKACRVAKADAKANGFGKEPKHKGGFGSVDCPVCEKGKLKYSVAGYNGHMHAACTTEGCVSWME